MDGIKSKTAAYRFLYAVLGPVMPLLKRMFPKYVTTTQELGRAMIRVAKVGKDFTPAQFTILGWQVSGIEKVVAGLRGKGVEFERYGFLTQDELGIWTAPTGDKVAWFKDPDGNVLSVSEHV